MNTVKNTVKHLMLAVVLFGLAGCGNVQEKTALTFVRKHIIEGDKQAADALSYMGHAPMDNIGTYARINNVVYSDVVSGMKITSDVEKEWQKQGAAEVGVILKGKKDGEQDVEKKVIVSLKNCDGKWLVSGLD